MRWAHTMYRIGDIDKSLAFYRALGFEERGRVPIGDEAVNIFLGLKDGGDTLELTHNFGVSEYELGSGYGHIALITDDLDSTLRELAAAGIKPEKDPYVVSTSKLCFVRDPDNYRIELIEELS